MNSLWQKTAKRPVFPTLSGGFSTDVLIVGGGMAGLLCAYRLTEAGVDCALVESGRICDCANCPPYYGYRYGRWYYGHDHIEGCEFGGNKGNGGRD